MGPTRLPLILTEIAFKGHVVPGLFVLREMSQQSNSCERCRFAANSLERRRIAAIRPKSGAVKKELAHGPVGLTDKINTDGRH